jgi:hypothetical protein
MPKATARGRLSRTLSALSEVRTDSQVPLVVGESG